MVVGYIVGVFLTFSGSVVASVGHVKSKWRLLQIVLGHALECPFKRLAFPICRCSANDLIRDGFSILLLVLFLFPTTHSQSLKYIVKLSVDDGKMEVTPDDHN